MSTVRGPAPRPCDSCPYRRDVPSGIWAADEYAKLPPYDRPTPFQPVAMFLCHQQDGRVCAGWAGCHDGQHLLALRFAGADSRMSPADLDATIGHALPAPLFGSGAEAAAHGTAELDTPSPADMRSQEKLLRRRATTGGAS